MASPFPGMDPYLEGSPDWSDFHLEFITCLRRALNHELPDNYDARIQERVTVIESFDKPAASFVPDAVVGREQVSPALPRQPSGAALLDPVTVPLVIPQREREAYIEIYGYPDQSLVAVIEVLSPKNKSSRGREEYLLKRDAILTQEVHLVELDLLVGGQRLPTAKPIPPDDYYAFVAHRDRRPLCNVYHWSVRQPLPAVPVPLDPPDSDAIIELQPVLAEALLNGRYDRRLPYGSPPVARLSRADREWAAELAATARVDKR